MPAPLPDLAPALTSAALLYLAPLVLLAVAAAFAVGTVISEAWPGNG